MLTTVRVQEKGQVTIPSNIRKKLKLKKGDLVTVTMSQDGVVIQPVTVAVRETMNQLSRSLEARGFQLETVLAACQRAGGERAIREFGLSEAEISQLFTALQLQAQQALESIRSQSENAGLDQLSEEEINAEIQAVRHEETSQNRP